MTQQQMLESIQQVYPDMGETQLRLLLNDALDEFVEETRILSDVKELSFIEYLTNHSFIENIDGWEDYWGSGSSDPSSTHALESYRIEYGTAGSVPFTSGQGLKNTNGIKLYKNIKYNVSVTATAEDIDGSNTLTSLVALSNIDGGTTLNAVPNIGIGISTFVSNILTMTYTITATETNDYYIYALFNHASETKQVHFNELSIKPVDSSNRYYVFKDFNNEILSINKVDLDNIALNRYIGPIEDTDVT